jgi:hypothetical protein
LSSSAEKEIPMNFLTRCCCMCWSTPRWRFQPPRPLLCMLTTACTHQADAQVLLALWKGYPSAARAAALSASRTSGGGVRGGRAGRPRGRAWAWWLWSIARLQRV